MAESLEQLLRRVEQRDEAAVVALVQAFGPAAQRLAQALLGDEHEAEEAIQDAFVTALAQISSLKSPAAFPAWFRQIVRTQCNRICRRHQPRTSAGFPDLADARRSPLEQAEVREAAEHVRAAVQQLTPARRDVVELFYLHELTVSEVAAELHVPAGTVKRRLHDARVSLSALLAGAALPPEAP